MHHEADWCFSFALPLETGKVNIVLINLQATSYKSCGLLILEVDLPGFMLLCVSFACDKCINT
jgi:hypothetical protein